MPPASAPTPDRVRNRLFSVHQPACLYEFLYLENLHEATSCCSRAVNSINFSSLRRADPLSIDSTAIATADFKSIALRDTNSAAAAFATTMSRLGRVRLPECANNRCISFAIAACKSSKVASATPKSAGCHRLSARRSLPPGKRLSARGRNLVQPIAPCTQTRGRYPSWQRHRHEFSSAHGKCADQLDSSAHRLVSGPNKLNIVRPFKSSRASCACFTAGCNSGA